ncbi:MAG: hypothetical protein EA388_10505 [Nitriliruptor sp.]|nr:MAG: hypothetical protein EA388_10505 [Nitriliruptor sp.]
MTETEDRAMARSAPTHADLERAIESVPGVAEAHVTMVEATGKSRLRIRLANDEDAESVSWSIAATLRERFGISLDPDQIQPRAVPMPLTDAGVDADATDAVDESTGGPETLGIEVADDAAEERADEQDGVIVSGDRVLLSEAARALLEDAVAEARAAEREDDAPVVDDAPASEDSPVDPPAYSVTEPAETMDEAADTAAADTVAATADGRPDERPDATAAADPEPADTVAATADGRPDATAADTLDDAHDAVPADEAPGANLTVVADAHRDRGDGVRARIRHLDTRVDISDVQVTATLGFGDREVTGAARAVATEQGILRAVAEATLTALSELTGERLVAGIDSVAASVSGEPPIATVIVSLVTERGDEALLGSSLVRKDPQRAVMRATLDALNRRVEPWLEVEIAG